MGEVLRQSARHPVSRTATIHRREGTAAEEGTTAFAARSAVANREASINRGRANIRGDATGSPGDDKLKSANLRGISLVSRAGKILLKIVANRLSDFCEAQQILPEKQCRFRPGAVHHLHAVRSLPTPETGSTEENTAVNVLVNLQKAYHSVDR